MTNATARICYHNYEGLKSRYLVPFLLINSKLNYINRPDHICKKYNNIYIPNNIFFKFLYEKPYSKTSRNEHFSLLQTIFHSPSDY